MNESRMRLPSALISLCLAAGLGACAGSGRESPPLAGARMGGPFTLTDQNGHRLSDRDFAGKYRLVYFGYTFCPDVCPLDMQVIGAGLRRFEAQDAARAARVVPIFISVDPARDTPQVLRQFVSAFHPRIVGLTGSEAEIAQVAREYGVYYQRAPSDAHGNYAVNHSRTAILYDPDGRPVVPVAQDRGPQAVADDLARWVR